MNTFNKSSFAQLLLLAKGDRTITNYGNQCDISPAHISRLLRELVNARPLPATLKKFADFSYNNITYKVLMDNTGYNENNAIDDEAASLIGISPLVSDIVDKLSENYSILHLIRVCSNLEQHQISLLIQIAENFKAQKITKIK
ncbi:hypothetical protein [Clostridium tagluense]|uniref:hypothetical protein n=1 Tax=Clostridium tagluense TaxID=360422 RepID=UPI001CF451F3|nr:hypothetical protein [Clostridium tagluense]MCB2301045.1 hypothetical protein [Clostridium tagluense]